MSEIKVGEYVRNINGALGKITKVVDETIFYVQFYDNLEWKTDLEECPITKHSFNIIDLIEVGDYVNGYKVLDIAQQPVRALYLEDISQQNSALIPRLNDYIKSVVTKEQFEESEYKV